MSKKLISKAELARIKGVTPQSITYAIEKQLQAAMHGKRIDLNHPDVQRYLQQKIGVPGDQDPLYEKAIELCKEKGTYTVSCIARGFGINHYKAKRIFLKMQEAGHVPEDKKIEPPPPKPEKKAPPPPPDKPIKGVAHTVKTRKAESLKKLNLEEGNTIHEIPEDIAAFAEMTLRELIERFGTDTAFLDWLKATKSIEDINEKRLKNATVMGDLVSRELVKKGVFDHVNATHQKILTDGAKTINKRVRIMTEAGKDEKETEAFIIDQISSFIRPMKTKITRALKKLGEGIEEDAANV